MSHWTVRVEKLLALAKSGFAGFAARIAAERNIVLPLSARIHFWPGIHPDTEIFEVLAKAIPDDGAYLDIGGNVGIYVAALWAIKQGRLRGATFEPIPTSARILRETLAINGVKDFEIVQTALSSAEGELTLSNYSNGLNNIWLNGEVSVDGPTTRVPMTTVDQWLAHKPSVRPSAMKIDVEGHEIEVLKGARETIARFKPTIVVEMHCASWDALAVSRAEATSVIRELGYRSNSTLDGKPLDLQTANATYHMLLTDQPDLIRSA